MAQQQQKQQLPMQPGAPGAAPTPTTTGIERLAKMEEHLVSKLRQQTYQEARKRGEPVHGHTSVAILLLGGFSWLLQLAAICTCSWRQDWQGVFMYPTTRSWGLFWVKGVETLSWHTFQDRTCNYAGQLNFFAACGSPICQWYELKCKIYYEMSILNYVVGIIMVITLMWHGLCLLLTFKKTPRMLYWAANLWWVVALNHLFALTVHWKLMSEWFGQLIAVSFYPDPSFGASAIMSCLSLFLIFICAGLGSILSSMWPRECLESDDEDSELSDDEAAERRHRRDIRRKRGKRVEDDSSDEDNQGPRKMPAPPPTSMAQQGQFPPQGQYMPQQNVGYH